MGRNIEIEFKNMVNKENFTKLQQYFQIDENDFIIQKNHYFDTHGLTLGQKKAALRIREKEGRCELTLKKIAKNGVLEINQCISDEEANAILGENILPLGEVRDELILMNVDPESLEYKGMLQTRRAQVSFIKGQIMLDHSSYFEQEDFEIEYEVDEKDLLRSKNDFYKLLNELNIPRIHADNKIKRFFDAKKEGSH